MKAQQSHALADLLVGHCHEAAVTQREQVLAGIEAERRRDTRSRDPGRAEGLRGVFDDRNAELCELRQRRRTPEEMDGHDRLRAGRDPLGDVCGIEIHRRGVDVREHRRRTALHDRLGRRVEGERRTDDLVAGPDAHRVEDEDERVRSVCDPDRRWDAEVLSRLALEGFDVRAKDERSGLEHLADPLLQLGNQRRVLRLDVSQRDRGHEGPV